MWAHGQQITSPCREPQRTLERPDRLVAPVGAAGPGQEEGWEEEKKTSDASAAMNSSCLPGPNHDPSSRGVYHNRADTYSAGVTTV
jgi:hypothetical protein